MAHVYHFETTEDRKKYIEIFSENLDFYCVLATLVRDKIFKDYEWKNLDGELLEVVRVLVNELMYQTDERFKKELPIYKDGDDELFIPYRSFKESVTEALKEAIASTKEKNQEDG